MEVSGLVKLSTTRFVLFSTHPEPFFLRTCVSCILAGYYASLDMKNIKYIKIPVNTPYQNNANVQKYAIGINLVKGLTCSYKAQIFAVTPTVKEDYEWYMFNLATSTTEDENGYDRLVNKSERVLSHLFCQCSPLLTCPKLHVFLQQTLRVETGHNPRSPTHKTHDNLPQENYDYLHR